MKNSIVRNSPIAYKIWNEYFVKFRSMFGATFTIKETSFLPRNLMPSRMYSPFFISVNEELAKDM